MYLLIAISVLLFAGPPSLSQVKSTESSTDQEGRLLVHSFPDKIDSLSGQQIFELQDDSGVTTWFKRHIYKSVCLTGECKMIDLWLYWDGAGNYRRMEIAEAEPLTKTDHTAFDPSDYEKLDKLLRDTSSVLKDMNIEDLTGDASGPELDEVDGYTGATLVSLEQVVVKDAAYTCYSLWHTVYGPTQSAILEILYKRMNADYLTLLFESGNPAKILLAIDGVKRHPEYHSDFYPRIISFIVSENEYLSEKAIAYFQPARITDETLQKKLAGLIHRLNPREQNIIIWKLSELASVNVDVVFTLLDLYEKQMIGFGSLNLIYGLLAPKHLKDERILLILDRMKRHKNAYVRSLTEKLLNEDRLSLSR